jgi:hypothetical protein
MGYECHVVHSCQNEGMRPYSPLTNGLATLRNNIAADVHDSSGTNIAGYRNNLLHSIICTILRFLVFKMRIESVSSQTYELYLLIGQSIPVEEICIAILGVVYFEFCLSVLSFVFWIYFEFCF